MSHGLNEKRTSDCGREVIDLHHDAAVALSTMLPAEESCSGSVLEDFPDTLTRPGRAFQIMLSTDLLRNCHTFFRGYGPLTCLPEFINDSWIATKILLATDENDGQASAEMHDLGNPLLLHVVKRVGGIDGEADKNDMRVGVAQGPETVIVFLACGIPQGQLDMFAVDLDIGDIVLEDSWYVYLRECSL